MAATLALEELVNRYGLTQVYAPADGSIVDVVFVHGLNGHPRDTWTSDKEKVFWPAQLLPSIIEEEKARILVYGYDADTISFAGGASKDKIHNHAEHLVAALCANRRIRKAAERPLIFIAHSLGGLVVKRALIYSSELRGYHTEHLRSIYVSTYGILFLGTPHRGADMAVWGSQLQWIFSVVLPKKVVDSEPQLLQALVTNSETLQNIDRHFYQILPRFHIYFFHEGKPTNLKGTLRFIVGEDSASPNVHDVERASIQQDHVHMCKFENENSPGFDLLTEGIQRYAGAAPAIIHSRWDTERADKRRRREAELTELLPQALEPIGRLELERNSGSSVKRQLPAVTDDDIGLHVLYEIAGEGNSAPSVDIVAIHGIGAHPEDAWCKLVHADRPERGSVNWLKDKHMLPAVVPRARIMRYGYRTHSFGEESIIQQASTVASRLLRSLKWARKSFPHRPLIFIAHCFGGLVVLKAAIDAERQSDRWPGLSKSIGGILFFGTPFRDGGGLTQNEIIQVVQTQYEADTGEGFVQKPAADMNESLGDLVTTFLKMRKSKISSRIVCFFEQKSSYPDVIIGGSVIKKLIVDETSGSLDQSEMVESYPLFRDHLNINKFCKPEEEDFLTVCDAIEEITRQATEPVQAPPSAPSRGLRTIDDSLQHRHYTVGLICALPTELAAAVAMLDERHDPLPQNPHDDVNYSLGRMGNHNVVIACQPLGSNGLRSAARVANQLQVTFSSIRFGLMVGVGSGVPSNQRDIRLGDVVVSKPLQISGGVKEYDYQKAVEEGRFFRTGSLRRPPDVLLNAVSTLQARHLMSEPEFVNYLEEIAVKYPKMQRTYTYQGASNDQLFEAEYTHIRGEDTCQHCDPHQEILRPKRSDNIPVLFYGLIASAIHAMTDAGLRDDLSHQMGIFCFETEVAGLMDDFPCLVIRGICDYADSHMNKRWQPYAAAVAAAYAKELLSVIPASHVASTRPSAEVNVNYRAANTS